MRTRSRPHGPAGHADRPLAPASNQKLSTAMGALAVLGPDTRFTTTLRVNTAGDLLVEPRGDPTITTEGAHWLATLAAQVRAAGITTLPGSILIDESRHDRLRRAPGWAGGAATAALAPLCLELAGATDDGSEFSRADAPSAREWRVLLQAARTEPWWLLLHAGLPVAGRSGTLAGRLRGTPAEGTLSAKTGTIIGGTALSGYGTAASGRPLVFSVIVNGPGAEGAAAAVDRFVAAVAGPTA